MLAGTADLAKLKLPLLGSPKLDGIRAIIVDGTVVSRNLKPIPNRRIQAIFGKDFLNGLDGELIVGDPTAKDAFRQTSSGVMSIEGEPDAMFHVFDCCRRPHAPYLSRLQEARDVAAGSGRSLIVEQEMLTTMMELDVYEAEQLARGFEGVMLRHHASPYKNGRGTVSKQDLLKLKRFEDAEARVVGFEELLHNSNEATVGLLGQTERGHSKDGMVGMGTLGALRVVGRGGRWDGVRFNVGSGFDAATRAAIWADRAGWEGRLVKFKFFPIGSKEAPRFPIFLGERHPDDT
jgi:DNA ligase-1